MDHFSFLNLFIWGISFSAKFNTWTLSENSLYCCLLFPLCMAHTFHFCGICHNIVLTMGLSRHLFVTTLAYYCCCVSVWCLVLLSWLDYSSESSECPDLLSFLRRYNLGCTLLSWDESSFSTVHTSLHG